MDRYCNWISTAKSPFDSLKWLTPAAPRPHHLQLTKTTQLESGGTLSGSFGFEIYLGPRDMVPGHRLVRAVLGLYVVEYNAKRAPGRRHERVYTP